MQLMVELGKGKTRPGKSPGNVNVEVFPECRPNRVLNVRPEGFPAFFTARELRVHRDGQFHGQVRHGEKTDVVTVPVVSRLHDEGIDAFDKRRGRDARFQHEIPVRGTGAAWPVLFKVDVIGPDAEMLRHNLTVSRVMVILPHGLKLCAGTQAERLVGLFIRAGDTSQSSPFATVTMPGTGTGRIE